VRERRITKLVFVAAREGKRSGKKTAALLCLPGGAGRASNAVCVKEEIASLFQLPGLFDSGSAIAELARCSLDALHGASRRFTRRRRGFSSHSHTQLRARFPNPTSRIKQNSCLMIKRKIGSEKIHL
jgi:hypothetical protein